MGGGKGGVGKTFVLANLGVLLAREGFRVIAIDGDLEGANLHTHLGVQPPRVSLADFVAHRVEDLGKLLVETSVPNLQLIAGTHANLWRPQPGHAERIALATRLRELPADWVLLDLGAGAHPSVVDYYLEGDDGVVVVTPEPTAVENLYGFLRAAFYRRLRLAMVSPGVRELVSQAMDQRNERGIRTPLELLREVRSAEPEEGARFLRTMRQFRPRIVVNEVRTAEDVRLGFAIRSVCRKYFGIEADYLGYVNQDEAARRAVGARRPLVDAAPGSDAAVYLGRIARKLAAALPRERATTSGG